ncbi:sporulation protein YtxC [Bacillus testis]|uniref:sporulation protein YtxC n=1 Tax=Bacillus testis TaxID=1622072 RepID=UPI00067E9A2F|nr:sporulation protein YtxC [Bacillus testis]
MVAISFDSVQQADLFMDRCRKKKSNEQLLSHIEYNQEQAVITLPFHRQRDALYLLQDAFFCYIQDELVSQWFHQIVKEAFFYREQEECDQIVDIAMMLIMAENDANHAFWHSLQKSIEAGLDSVLEREVSFSFSSFLTFRKRRIMKSLLSYVETAIDEYKMEQEYLNFIHTLRSFMHSVTPKKKQLHVVHGEHFTFFDESFSEIVRAELVSYTDRRLFSDYPMYIDSHVLAPLISIAPEQLSIYSDAKDQAILRTIQSIFEERVRICPLSAFAESRYPQK